jgi:uncharacterized protein YceK
VKHWLLTLAIASGCSSFATMAVACPNCKEAVAAQPGEGSTAADGYNWSILFMLAVPFSMLGAGTVLVRRAVKQGAFPEL